MNLLDLFGASENVETFPPETTIFEEGSAGEVMYVILDGEVEILVGDVTVEVAGPGGIVGELALIDTKARSATARARSAVRLARVDRACFLAMVRQEPEFSLHVMQVLGDRLRRMDSTMTTLRVGV